MDLNQVKNGLCNIKEFSKFDFITVKSTDPYTRNENLHLCDLEELASEALSYIEFMEKEIQELKHIRHIINIARTTREEVE